MDVLVGVRLHSLIYAAVMGVTMIGISYDPKVDSFLASIDRPTLCRVEEFTLEKFQEAFQDTMSHREAIRGTAEARLDIPIEKLGKTEELIRVILERKKGNEIKQSDSSARWPW